MDIKNIKDKRQEVAYELRKIAKKDSPCIDTDIIHEIIFWHSSIHPTKDTTVAEYDEYDREICNALADLIEPTCDFLPKCYAIWYDKNDKERCNFNLEDLYDHGNAYYSKCGSIMMAGEGGEDG